MPTLSATSSAVFSSVGLDANVIYTTMTGLIGTAIDFGLWLVELSLPFLLVLGFIYLIVRLMYKFTGLGR